MNTFMIILNPYNYYCLVNVHDINTRFYYSTFGTDLTMTAKTVDSKSCIEFHLTDSKMVIAVSTQEINIDVSDTAG